MDRGSLIRSFRRGCWWGSGPRRVGEPMMGYERNWIAVPRDWTLRIENEVGGGKNKRKTLKERAPGMFDRRRRNRGSGS